MSRPLAAASLVLLWAFGVAAAEAPTGRPVDLDAPGTLEVLQRSNPAHFERVQKILDGVLGQRDADVPRWIRVAFGGSDVRYAPIVLTSYPPKRRLAFALDGTPYEAVITLTSVRGTIIPAK